MGEVKSHGQRAARKQMIVDLRQALPDEYGHYFMYVGQQGAYYDKGFRLGDTFDFVAACKWASKRIKGIMIGWNGTRGTLYMFDPKQGGMTRYTEVWEGGHFVTTATHHYRIAEFTQWEQFYELVHDAANTAAIR